MTNSTNNTPISPKITDWPPCSRAGLFLACIVLMLTAVFEHQLPCHADTLFPFYHTRQLDVDLKQ